MHQHLEIHFRKYNNYFEGEYLLYENKELGSSVHVMYRKCENTASCNCAVAVQQDDDVFVISKCTKKRTSSTTLAPIAVEVYSPDSEVAAGFKLFSYNEGREYQV